jgi:hypothetical protein
VIGATTRRLLGDAMAWPMKIVTVKIVVLGLGGASAVLMAAIKVIEAPVHAEQTSERDAH